MSVLRRVDALFFAKGMPHRKTKTNRLFSTTCHRPWLCRVCDKGGESHVLSGSRSDATREPTAASHGHSSHGNADRTAISEIDTPSRRRDGPLRMVSGTKAAAPRQYMGK